jgi:hypothetical protein
MITFIIFGIVIKKDKVKLSRYRHAGIEGKRMYSSFSFLTFAVDGVSGKSHSFVALYHGGITPGPIG